MIYSLYIPYGIPGKNRGLGAQDCCLTAVAKMVWDKLGGQHQFLYSNHSVIISERSKSFIYDSSFRVVVDFPFLRIYERWHVKGNTVHGDNWSLDCSKFMDPQDIMDHFVTESGVLVLDSCTVGLYRRYTIISKDGYCCDVNSVPVGYHFDRNLYVYNVETAQKLAEHFAKGYGVEFLYRAIQNVERERIGREVF